MSVDRRNTVYKRFTGYVHEYIDEQQGKTAGFVRCEVKENRWKFQVQIRCSELKNKKTEIYGYWVRGLEKKQELFWRGRAKDGCLCTCIRMMTENWKAELSVPDGIRIPLTDRKTLICCWSDADEKEAVIYLRDIPEDGRQRKEENADRRLMKFSETAENEPQKKMPATAENEPQKEMPETTENEPQKKMPATAENEPQKEMPEAAENEPQKKMPETNESETLKEDVSVYDSDWEWLKGSRTRISPFREENWYCLAVCPGDILQLQSRGWPIGRSSLAIQQFHSYRHLLLARCEDGTFIYGLPGNAGQRDLRQARQFGFPNFRPSDQMHSRIQPCGYWYRIIQEKTLTNE